MFSETSVSEGELEWETMNMRGEEEAEYEAGTELFPTFTMEGSMEDESYVAESSSFGQREDSYDACTTHTVGGSVPEEFILDLLSLPASKDCTTQSHTQSEMQGGNNMDALCAGQGEEEEFTMTWGAVAATCTEMSSGTGKGEEGDVGAGVGGEGVVDELGMGGKTGRVGSDVRRRRRREFHKIHTRRSRAKLNEKMEMLRSVLPEPPSGMVVKSKAQIIDYAISMLAVGRVSTRDGSGI